MSPFGHRSLTLLALAVASCPAVDVVATTLAGGARDVVTTSGHTLTVVDSLGGITGPAGSGGTLSVSLGQATRVFGQRRPVVFNSNLTANADTPLVESVVAADGDNDPVAISLVSPPRLGQVILSPNGSFTYLAPRDAGGVDSFQVRGFDGGSFSDPATITVTVRAIPTVTRALIPNLTAPYVLKAGTPVTFAIIGGTAPYKFTTSNGDSARQVSTFRRLDIDADGQLDSGALGQLTPVSVVSSEPTTSGVLTITDSLNVSAVINYQVVSTPPVKQEPAPPVPTSPKTGVTLFGALGGQTPQGTTSLVKAFANVSAKVAVAYVWDASKQEYVTLPDEPFGGMSADNGVFIAARVDLPINLDGTPTTLPHDIVLSRGWNFIAIPLAVDDSGNKIPTFDPVRDVFYKEVDGTSLNAEAQSQSVGGEFYAWDGSLYEPTTVLEVGHAYWVENTTSDQRPLVMTIKSGAGLRGVAKSTRATHPPLPPGASSVANAAQDVVGGCGSGGGIALVLAGTLALVGRIRRRDRA